MSGLVVIYNYMDKDFKNEDLILNQIRELRDKLKQKSLARGEAIRDGGGYHENSAAESADQEIHFLESRIRELNKQLSDFYGKH